MSILIPLIKATRDLNRHAPVIGFRSEPPPVAEVIFGDAYIVLDNATGDWFGLDDNIVRNQSTIAGITNWVTDPFNAADTHIVYVREELSFYVFDTTAKEWIEFTLLGPGLSNEPPVDAEFTSTGEGLPGSSALPSRDDHVHDLGSPSEPLPIGDEADIGTGSAPAREDHVHAHGNQPGGSLHAVAVANSASGFMSGADKSKLNGIATGAEVNTVDSVHGRTGDVVGAAGDYNFTDISGVIDDTQHGNQGGGFLHDVATSGADGFMSSSDKDKLDGLSPGIVTLCNGKSHGQTIYDSSGSLSILEIDFQDGTGWSNPDSDPKILRWTGPQTRFKVWGQILYERWSGSTPTSLSWAMRYDIAGGTTFESIHHTSSVQQGARERVTEFETISYHGLITAGSGSLWVFNFGGARSTDNFLVINSQSWMVLEQI